jgi:hypothetical protein
VVLGRFRSVLLVIGFGVVTVSSKMSIFFIGGWSFQSLVGKKTSPGGAG